MCRQLDDLRQSITAYAAGFDARSLAPSQADEVVRVCAQMEASIASVKALAAARSAEASTWKHHGYRSAADQLAHDTGMSPANARRALETGQRLADQAEVAQAALAGDLSAEQATAVCDGVAANRAKAAELIDMAKQPRCRSSTRRWPRSRPRPPTWRLAARPSTPSAPCAGGPTATAPCRPTCTATPKTAPGCGGCSTPSAAGSPSCGADRATSESFEALDYDAIMTMAAIAAGQEGELGLHDLVELGLFPQLAAVSRPADRPPPPLEALGRGQEAGRQPARIMVRVDLDSLLRGVATEGELCEIAGYGPVPVSVVQDLLANDNPFVVGILTKSTRSKASTTTAARPPRIKTRPSTFSTRPVPPKAARPGPTSNPTTERTGTKPNSPSSTSSTGCARITIASRPTKAGPWSKAPANGTSSRPATPATPATGSRPHPGDHHDPPRPSVPANSSAQDKEPNNGRLHHRRRSLPLHDDTLDLRGDTAWSIALDQRAFGPRRTLAVTADRTGRVLGIAHCERTDPPELALRCCLETLDDAADAVVAYSDEPVTTTPPPDLRDRLQAAGAVATERGVHLVDWFLCDDDRFRSMRLSVDPQGDWWNVV